MAATVTLIALGLLASVLAAQMVARNESEQAQQEFEYSSANVASMLQLSIQHEEDLVDDAGGLLADRELSQTSFRLWATAARTADRYPEMTGLSVMQLVDNADLAAFAAQAEADPSGPLAHGTFEVEPAGTRSFYCLIVAAISSGSVPNGPAGHDYCADPLVSVLLVAARDTGVGAHLPYPHDGDTWLEIHTPFYEGGVVPETVDARRAAFVGLVVTLLDPTVLVDRALRDDPGLGVDLVYDKGLTNVSFTSGTHPTGAQSATIDIGQGWTVHTFAAVKGGGVTQGAALVRLLGGIALALLLGLLMFVLGTGRERARRQLGQRTRELHYQALHDPLTGLPNRALVLDRLTQMLVRDRRQHTVGALLFLDIDDFKNVNDTLGHGAGDRLLIAVTARLSSTLRDADTIGRMGGDEFVVLLDGSTLDVAPELVAQRLLDVMHQPFELEGLSSPLTVNISIGIAIGDSGSGNAEELLRDADVALYQAKAAGKNGYEIFDPQMQTTISRHTDLAFDLRSALAESQFRLVYQPIYNLADLTVVGVECLLRWDHPTRGPIGPDEFIPILEQTGQIREVGRWVLHHACQQMATWHSRGDVLDVSINVSGRQLDDDGIADDVRDALQASGLSPTSLILEVTETALMHNVEATAARLRAIKELGVRIAVDDFGTGYSSLAYLRQFPVDCLKIDRAFTSAVTASPESRALIDTLVQLGRDLGLSTLAEGVETADEMDILRLAHVDQAQGFLMARPQTPEDLETEHLAPRRPTESGPVHVSPV